MRRGCTDCNSNLIFLNDAQQFCAHVKSSCAQVYFRGADNIQQHIIILHQPAFIYFSIFIFYLIEFILTELFLFTFCTDSVSVLFLFFFKSFTLSVGFGMSSTHKQA